MSYLSAMDHLQILVYVCIFIVWFVAGLRLSLRRPFTKASLLEIVTAMGSGLGIAVVGAVVSYLLIIVVGGGLGLVALVLLTDRAPDLLRELATWP